MKINQSHFKNSPQTLKLFNKIYTNYYMLLMRRCFKRTGNIQDSEDYIQDAALKTLEKGKDLRKEGMISYFTTTAQFNATSRPTRRKSAVEFDTWYQNKENNVTLIQGASHPDALYFILEKERKYQMDQNIKELYIAIELLPTRYKQVIKRILKEKPIGDFYASNRARNALFKLLKNKVKF